jgi:hypothetical protein
MVANARQIRRSSDSGGAAAHLFEIERCAFSLNAKIPGASLVEQRGERRLVCAWRWPSQSLEGSSNRRDTVSPVEVAARVQEIGELGTAENVCPPIDACG